MNKLKILSSALHQVADNIDAGNSSLDEEELNEILTMINKTAIADNKLSKYQACKYLNISRATFDNYVKDGKIPEGRKQVGFKELYWYLEDLKKFKNSK